MKKIIALFFTVFFSGFLFAQEKFPVFDSCQNVENEQLETCFYNQVQDFVYDNFKLSDNLTQQNYRGKAIILFEVTQEGKFKVQYVDADQAELIEESKRVFELFPTIQPPTYNGQPTYSKYTITLNLPLGDKSIFVQQPETKMISSNQLTDKDPRAALEQAKQLKKDVENPEYDAIVYKKFENPQYKSHLNIPFSHSFYSHFDSQMNQVGTNNHTASKPYSYEDVAKYYDFEKENNANKIEASSWLERKLFNENLVEIQGENYWFTLNPVLDLQVGKSSSNIKSNSTYINTRALQVQGGLGKNLNFSTTIYETQAKFANYYNLYSASLKPSGGNPAIVPGLGIAKEFKTDSFDIPLAEANLTFSPSQFIDLQVGYSRNFIGDGYRSLITSDGSSPYPFFKINTTFWKIKYTNTYMWLKDVRPEVTLDGTYAKKYMANHYLSWNATKRLNIGFFESVVWSNENNRGFDAGFANPIIFYRSVEFAASSKTGNALLGVTSKYKVSNQINVYGQFLLDEFSLGDVKKQEKSWKNKYAYQLGIKYFNAFGVKKLLLQAEYNNVRPYVYSHSSAITNYGQYNQSLGHQWGGNFREFVAIGRYHYDRFFADAKFTVGIRGLDFNSATDNLNYGSNIYLSYDDNRAYETQVKIGQGNKTNVFIADLQAGYLVNPSTNLKLFGSFIYRNFDPNTETASVLKDTTTWISFGIRSDIFNWYFDY